MHARNIHVIMDGVFNHVSAGNTPNRGFAVLFGSTKIPTIRRLSATLKVKGFLRNSTLQRMHLSLHHGRMQVLDQQI